MPTPDPSWPPHVQYMAAYAAEGLATAQLVGLVLVLLVAAMTVGVLLRR
jgi:hypothetical protein